MRWTQWRILFYPLMDVRSHEGNKKGIAIKGLDLSSWTSRPWEAVGKHTCSSTIRTVHSRDRHTRETTALNINTCQCRCDTSRDETWTLISRCNTACTGIREESKDWEWGEGKQGGRYITVYKQGRLRTLRLRTVFRPNSIHERWIGLSGRTKRRMKEKGE
jgi:hypothetical protein